MAAERTTAQQQVLVNRYTRLIQEAKDRMDWVYALNQANVDRNVPVSIFDIEAICLQIRKTLELIVLGSLITSQSVYEATYDDIAKLWNAKTVVARVKEINPNFYPEPKGPIEQDGEIKKVADFSGDYLTLDRWMLVTDRTNEWLHATNPFKRKTPPPLDQMPQRITTWLSWITMLLNHHWVHLADSGDQLAAIMQTDTDGAVQVSYMKQLEHLPYSSPLH